MKTQQSIIIIIVFGLVAWVLLFALGRKESDTYKLPTVETKENQTRKRNKMITGVSVFVALFIAYIAFKTYQKNKK